MAMMYLVAIISKGMEMLEWFGGWGFAILGYLGRWSVDVMAAVGWDGGWDGRSIRELGSLLGFTLC